MIEWISNFREETNPAYAFLGKNPNDLPENRLSIIAKVITTLTVLFSPAIAGISVLFVVIVIPIARITIGYDKTCYLWHMYFALLKAMFFGWSAFSNIARNRDQSNLIDCACDTDYPEELYCQAFVSISYWQSKFMSSYQNYNMSDTLSKCEHAILHVARETKLRRMGMLDHNQIPPAVLPGSGGYCRACCCLLPLVLRADEAREQGVLNSFPDDQIVQVMSFFIRGTTNVLDFANDFIALSDATPPELRIYEEFFIEQARRVKDYNDNPNALVKIVLVVAGFSWGGGIAMVLGIKWGVSAFSYNGIGFGRGMRSFAGHENCARAETTLDKYYKRITSRGCWASDPDVSRIYRQCPGRHYRI
ncbi:MAG: hypothetical protein LBC42_01660, partial [Puniceicoccales bacterium]|nr:hypothetical protein [Puniceicoccales bacterium]